MANNEIRKYVIILILLDVLSIVLSGFFSVWIRFNSFLFRGMLVHGNPNANYFAVFFLIIPTYLVVNSFIKLYKTEFDHEFRHELKKIVFSNLICVLILMSLTFITREGLIYSRFVLFVFVASNTFTTILSRGLYRRYINRKFQNGFIQKRIALIGMGKLAEVYINSTKDYVKLGYRLEGIILPERDENQKGYMGYKVLGCIDDLVELNKQYEFDEVIIAVNFNETTKLERLVRICDSEGIRIKIIPSYYGFLRVGASTDDMNGLTLLVVRGIPLDNIYNRILKRIYDIAFSMFVIIVTAPVMLFVAIGVLVTSKGPVLYKQERVGLNNKAFNMLKFRSMKVQNDGGDKSKWTNKNDPRKTKFGAFIRKTSLDELPQFFNVLKGDMSVVGPRPERPFWVNEFKGKVPEYMLRHYVKSGITGWAQVNGWRGDTSIEERIKCDNYYIQNWSLWLDMKICVLTIARGFTDKNAY